MSVISPKYMEKGVKDIKSFEFMHQLLNDIHNPSNAFQGHKFYNNWIFSQIFKI